MRRRGRQAGQLENLVKASKVDECHLTITLVVPEGGIPEDTNDIVIARVSLCLRRIPQVWRQ